MTNRKKRLQKGIESISKQISLHERKKSAAIESGEIELADYYEKELKSLKDSKKNKEEKL